MQRKTLLLINGNQVIMDMNKRILEKAGFNVNTALGFDKALEELERHTPDGIILASTPNGDSGFGFISEVKSCVNVPILYISEKRDDEMAVLHAGANEFLRKPYNFEVFLTRVKLMLNRAEFVNTIQDAYQPELYVEDSIVAPLSVQQQGSAQDFGAEKELLSIVERPSIRLSSKIAIASVAAFLLVGGLFALFMIRAPEEIIAIDQPVPLAEFTPGPGNGFMALSELSRSIEILLVDDVSIPAGATGLSILLENSAWNAYDFVFEIFLKDSGESLFTSGLVAPGGFVDIIDISRGLEVGTHDALLQIRICSPDDGRSINSIGVEFAITAH